MSNINLINNNLENEKVEALTAEEIKAAASAKKLNSNDIFKAILQPNGLRVVEILGIQVGAAINDADEKAMKELVYGLVQGELTKAKVIPTVMRLQNLLMSGADLKKAGVVDIKLVDIIENEEVIGTYILKDNKAYDLVMAPICEADPRLKEEFIEEYLTEKVKEYLLEESEDEYDEYDELDAEEEDC